MPNPPFRRDQAEETIKTVEQCLEDGFAPPYVNTGHAKAQIEASRRLSITPSTLRTRLKSSRDRFGLEPDWRLWKDPTQEKIKNRVEAPAIVRMRAHTTADPPEGPKYRVLTIGDAHQDPKIPNERFEWIGRYIADEEIDYVYQMGDWSTFDSFSTHDPQATFAGQLKPRFQEDINGHVDSVQRFQRGLGTWVPKRKKIVLGNHDCVVGGRIGKYENFHPELVGVLGVLVTDCFEDHGWEWVEYGKIDYLGGVGFVHVPFNEIGREYGGKTAESRIANDSVHDLVYGHSHKRRSFRVSKIGPTHHVTITNVGCALPWGHVEHYARHNPTGWWWGVVELTIQGGHITEQKDVSMLELERRYG